MIGIEVFPATAAGCPEPGLGKRVGPPRAGVEETGPFGVAPVPACVELANDNKNREDGENRCCRPLASPWCLLWAQRIERLTEQIQDLEDCLAET
ncbi:hypothetical protein GCM10010503_66400 [Streptomyces lucensis JCM 4490]|uniref:Uncharacterized protein n=1 Tax=Streptomyces lucensis JCM 4490 TaxID=1306176 RepID=A0A918MVW2_9ACTN|nr:hypothetical protein GCM10010503_66400 [Streptomyces lucensis JCM 4490]